MTKSQEVKNDKTPSKYTTFYLIMLILTTISLGFGFFSIGAIGATLSYVKTAPLFAALTLVQYAATLLMAAALVYLYNKKELGLHLLISAYGLTTICMVVFPIATQPLIPEAAMRAVAEGKGQITMESATQILQITFTSIAVINALSAILFAVLWYFAWKKQAQKDTTAV